MKRSLKIIKGNLVLRSLTQEDLELIRYWRNREDIRDWFFSTKIITKEEQRNWYCDYLKNLQDFVFLIDEVDIFNRTIGTISLYNINQRLREAELGRFIIGDGDANGKGWGPKVVNMVCELAYKEFGLNRVFLKVFKCNLRAINVYEKSGFKSVKEEFLNGQSILVMEKCLDE